MRDGVTVEFRRSRPRRLQYGSERERCKGVILKRVPPRALMADIARGVGARGRLSGPVLVEGSALDRDSPAARCGKDRRERHTAMTDRLGIGRRGDAPRRFGGMVPVLLFFEL